MKRRNRAFTMIELLLALMLTSLLTASLSLMIGQAARDRAALNEQPASPAWAGRSLMWLEHDLRHAHWWAGAEDRLVLIGPGQDGAPAKIEYRWSDVEQATAWVRHEQPLTTESPGGAESSRQVIALNPAGMSAGPYHFGKTESTPNALSIRPRADEHRANASVLASGASVLIDGRRIALRPIPDRITLELALRHDDTPPLRREVIFR